MVKIKKMKVQITIYKTLQRKLNIEQRNVTFATNINEILLIQFEFEWIRFSRYCLHLFCLFFSLQKHINIHCVY
jgi:hypothetical protein